jgi:hypothetical protein
MKFLLLSVVAFASAVSSAAFVPSAPFVVSSKRALCGRTSIGCERKFATFSGLRSAKATASPPKPFELPPVLGLGFKSLNKRLVVITGTTSGLGLSTLKALLNRKDSFVVCAVRDVQKMKDIIAAEGLDTGSIAVLRLDLGSFKSVRDFVFNLKVKPCI